MVSATEKKPALNIAIPPRRAYEHLMIHFKSIHLCANSTGGQMKNIILQTSS